MQFYKTDFLSIDYVLLTLKINITGYLIDWFKRQLAAALVVSFD